MENFVPCLFTQFCHRVSLPGLRDFGGVTASLAPEPVELTADALKSSSTNTTGASVRFLHSSYCYWTEMDKSGTRSESPRQSRQYIDFHPEYDNDSVAQRFILAFL